MKSAGASQRPWRRSLGARLVGAWALLTAIVAGALGWLLWQGQRSNLEHEWRDRLSSDFATARRKLQSAAGDAARDVRYLAASPLVAEFLRQRGTPEEARWRRMVEDDFQALVVGKAGYFQMRLLSLDPDGSEIVRVDRIGAEVRAALPGELQKKGDRDYFQEAAQVAPGAVYLSDCNLNQERGKVSEPYTPTLRVAAKTQPTRPGGEPEALVIVNYDLGSVFSDLASQTGERVRLHVANERGDYLIHPLRSALYGADLGKRERFAADFGEMAGPEPVWRQGTSDGDLQLIGGIQLFAEAPRRASIAVVLPSAEVLRMLAGHRNRAIGWTVALAAVAGVVFTVGVRRPLRRLGHIVQTMEGYEPGDRPELSSERGSDEIGLLAERFDDLATRVREDRDKLDAARREAEEAIRAKEEFLAMMSHEIRTPLNALTGLLRVLERNRPATHQEPILKSLRAAAGQLLALVNDALDYSRLMVGRFEFQPVDFSLPDLVSDVMLTHRPAAARKGLESGWLLDPALPEIVRGDPVRLSQIIHNLVANAVKYTEHGFVRLAVRPGAAGTVVFEVSDSGEGIAEKDMGTIFSPYGRARSTGEGVGLGLAIVRALVDGQSGTIAVETAPGKGSRFTVELPMPAGSAVAVRSPEVAAPDFSTVQLLYVEDIESNRMVLRACLEETRAAIDEAGTGSDGLARLAEKRYDAVLVDLQLPDMSGLDLAREIAKRHPGVPMIAVTAQATPAAREDCLAAGMTGFVVKPVVPAALWTAIGDVLGKAPKATAQSVTSSAPPDANAAGGAVGGRYGEALIELFGDRPEKIRSVLQATAGEFRRHARTLAAALEAGEREPVRRVKHALTTAVAQFSLTEIGGPLAAWAASEAAPDVSAAQSVIQALERIAGEMAAA